MNPERIDRYEILAELGRGAMGVVYKAHDPLLDRIVAIKTLNLSLTEKELAEYEARFYQEAKAMGKATHPNIISLFDVGRNDDLAYMTMEYLEGRELRQILDSGKRLEIGRIADIARQAAEGLGHAHERDIIHRDIKPSNIMISKGGQVKIADFGIAAIPSSAVRTMTGMVMGSPQYMSPEQVTGKNVDYRTDIFSLGIVLYEMLTGSPPFEGENVHSIMYGIVNFNPPPPGTLNPEVPEMLDYIVAKALAKDAGLRYQSAKEMAEDLKSCGKRDNAAQPSPMRFEENDRDALPAYAISRDFDSLDATRQLAILTDFEHSSRIGAKSHPVVLWAGFLLFALLTIALVFLL